MDYNTADTIAIRLSKVNPWIFDEESRTWDRPEHICMFCEFTRPTNEYGTHASDCIWQMAKNYAVGMNDAPVASQEGADSPIESRVSELLGETEAVLAVGSRVRVDGYEGIVIANARESHYGYCPESMVIVRMPGGDAMKEIAYCEE